MKRILLLLFIFSSPAFAYDDDEANTKIVKCLITNQKIRRFTSGAELIMSCKKEYDDYQRYSCSRYRESACNAELGQVIFEVMKKFPKE